MSIIGCERLRGERFRTQKLLDRNEVLFKRFLEKYKGKGLDSVPWLEPAVSIAEISRTTEGEKAQKLDAASAEIEKCAAAAVVKLLRCTRSATLLSITSKPSSQRKERRGGG
jgi:hypothetical protein